MAARKAARKMSDASPRPRPRPKRARTGRPLTQIDWKQFAKLCAMQATLREIAAWFECSEDSIERAVRREHEMRFAEYHAQKAVKGLYAIRRKQYEVAMSGDRVMLIWLGKQYLDQSNKDELTGKGGTPLVPATTIYMPDNGRDPSA